MAVRFNTVILRELGLPSLAKLLLLAMADRSDRDGKNCFPSQSTLARDTGMTRRNIADLLSMLAQAGFLRHTGKRSRLDTVIYELQFDGDLQKKCDRFAAARESVLERKRWSASEHGAQGEYEHGAQGDMNKAASTLCTRQRRPDEHSSHNPKTLSSDSAKGGRPNGNFVEMTILPPNTPMNELAAFATEESERSDLPADLILRQVKAGTYRRPPESFDKERRRESHKEIKEFENAARAYLAKPGK